MSIEGIDAPFCAWKDALSDENAFESKQQVQNITVMTIRHRNAFIQEFEQENVYCPLFDDHDERGVQGRQWVRRFMRGLRARLDGWRGQRINGTRGDL